MTSRKVRCKHSDPLCEDCKQLLEDMYPSTPTPIEQPDKELRDALTKDFTALYVKRFTTNWVVERKVRHIEIDIMSLENVLSLIESHTKAEVIQNLRHLLHKPIEPLYPLTPQEIEDNSRILKRIAELEKETP